MSKEPAWIDISVKLAGVSYSLSVSPSEKITVMSVVQELNTAYDQLRQDYADKVPRADLLAMLLLTRSTKLQELELNADTGRIDQRLEALDRLLDNALMR